MGTPMTLVHAIEKRDVASARHILGYVDVNCNYLGVYPIRLAIENGDCDMVALLLTAGADVTSKPKGITKNKFNDMDALGLAEYFRDDPKGQYRMEGAIIVELMNDPEKRKERMVIVDERIQKANDKDLKRACLLLLAMIPFILFFFVIFGTLDDHLIKWGLIEEGNGWHQAHHDYRQNPK